MLIWCTVGACGAYMMDRGEAEYGTFGEEEQGRSNWRRLALATAVAAVLFVLACAGTMDSVPSTGLSESAALRLAAGAFQNTPPSFRVVKEPKGTQLASASGMKAQEAIAQSSGHVIDRISDHMKRHALEAVSKKLSSINKNAALARVAAKHAVETTQGLAARATIAEHPRALAVHGQLPKTITANHVLPLSGLIGMEDKEIPLSGGSQQVLTSKPERSGRHTALPGVPNQVEDLGEFSDKFVKNPKHGQVFWKSWF